MSKDSHSTHYDAGGIETIDIIRAKLTAEQYRGYLLGNVLKYACRMEHKGCRDDDARKLATYAMWLAEEGGQADPEMESAVRFVLDDSFGDPPPAPPRHLLRVEPQPEWRAGPGNWRWLLPGCEAMTAMSASYVVGTSSREWWEWVPIGSKPHPRAWAVAQGGIWYWAIPQDEEATKCSQ